MTKLAATARLFLLFVTIEGAFSKASKCFIGKLLPVFRNYRANGWRTDHITGVWTLTLMLPMLVLVLGFSKVDDQTGFFPYNCTMSQSTGFCWTMAFTDPDLFKSEGGKYEKWVPAEHNYGPFTRFTTSLLELLVSGVRHRSLNNANGVI